MNHPTTQVTSLENVGACIRGRSGFRIDAACTIPVTSGLRLVFLNIAGI